MFRKKSLFSVLLALMISLSMFPIFKLDAHAATVNASTIAELQQAINDATEATEIVLTADMQLTATVTVPARKDITLRVVLLLQELVLQLHLISKKVQVLLGKTLFLMVMQRIQTIRVLSLTTRVN